MIVKNNCLIIRKYGNVGDLLMMIPALKEFSKLNIITLALRKEYFDVFKNLDFITSIITLDEIVNKNYDNIYDLSDCEFNYEQIAQPIINLTKQEVFASMLNVKIKDLSPIINLTKEELEITDEIKRIADNKKIIVIGLASSNPQRDWTLNNWKELILKLKNLGYKIIVADKTIKWDDNEIYFYNNRSLRELFSLVKISDYVISLDSGLLHIAGAFKTLCLGIFGPTDPLIRCVYDNCYYVKSNFSCSPCWYNRCEQVQCMKSLTVNLVEKKFLEVLNNGY